MTYNSTTMDFWCAGEISVSERGRESTQPGTYWDAIKLVDAIRDRLGVSFGIGEEDEQFRIRAGDYHIPGEVPGQAFHAQLYTSRHKLKLVVNARQAGDM